MLPPFPPAARRLLVAVILAAGLSGACARADDKDTTPKLVKLNELIAAIKEHKGKVVVVDFWADT
jgi:hypothetical protein